MSDITAPATSKGQRRRQEIIEGAAALLREQGPGSVSHRAVAQRVGCSLSAMTYYFAGLEDLLSEAGRVNIARWASRAERTAETAEAAQPQRTPQSLVELILAATLPVDEELLGHYLQLVAAGESPPVRIAYRTGRHRLNAAVGRVLRAAGCRWPPELVISLVDGACVNALSEGRDARASAEDAVRQLMAVASPGDPGALSVP